MISVSFPQFASIALFIATGLLLAYASMLTPTFIKRFAAVASFATLLGAITFMIASPSGNSDFGPLSAHLERMAALNRGSATGNDASSFITDCPDCPELVPIPSAYFRMGALRGDADAISTEYPARHVMIRTGYAIGRTEITVGQYAAFIRDSGYPRPACGMADPARNARLPIDCITWADAVAYTRWLSEKTGRYYRLPTEAEWQHAASGGSGARYAFGDEIPTGDANLGQRRFRRTPVGTYPANAFGLRDMHGSVAEMVADCWTDTLARLPGDGRLRNTSGDCARRVMKDAHATEAEELSRLSARRPISITEHRPGVGFRVVRD